MIKMKEILMEQLIVPALSSTGTYARTGFNLSKGGGNRGIGRLGRPEDGVDVDLPQGTSSYSSEEKIQELFKTARTWRSTTSDWQSVKAIAFALRDEMSGLGSGNTLQLLKKIKTKAHLAALVKNFVFNGDDLYDWLAAEYTISWDSVVKALSAFKNDMPNIKYTLST